MTNKQLSIIYRINVRDEIVFVNGLWDRVALANNSSNLIYREIVGRPIWEFITGYVSQDLYKQLVKKVRSGKPVRFNFRCDTPETRRQMEMCITLRKNEQVQFESKIILAEKRPFQRLFCIDTPRSEDIINACGWCKKINVEKDVWLESEEAISVMGIFENNKLPNISHGICGDCHGPWLKEIDEQKKKNCV